MFFKLFVVDFYLENPRWRIRDRFSVRTPEQYYPPYLISVGEITLKSIPITIYLSFLNLNFGVTAGGGGGGGRPPVIFGVKYF